MSKVDNNDLSRVYLFLAQQEGGIMAADNNGDGAITKSECSSFLLENFEWSDEDTDAAKKDLINSFWSKLDTNKSGTFYAGGTKFKQKNALDKKEIAAAEAKIKMYEILNNYTNSLAVPYGIEDGAAWRRSVAQGLLNFVEDKIKAGVKAEELEGYLKEESPRKEKKTTADYMALQLGNEFYGDAQFKSLIDNFCNSDLSSVQISEIASIVANIQEAYVATAREEGATDAQLQLLKKYGYNTAAGLNNQQKEKVRAALTTNLNSIKDVETDYKEYSKYYEDAKNEYIENILNTANFSDFASLLKLGVYEFKQSSQYKAAMKCIAVEKYFNSDELTNTLNAAFGDNGIMSGNIKGALPGDAIYEAFNKLKQEAIAKAKSGDFGSGDAIDTEALTKWIQGQIQKNISTYYSVGGGISGQSIDTIEKIYTSGIEGSEDLSSVQQTALLYLEAIISRNESYYKPIINEIVTGKKDGDYKSAIEGAQDSREVKKLIDAVQKKLAELGYAEHMSEDYKNSKGTQINAGNWANYWTKNDPDEKKYTYNCYTSKNEQQLCKLSKAIDLTNENGEQKPVDPARITFESTNSQYIDIDSYGNVKLKANLPENTYKTDIVVKIDGRVVSKKEITVQVKDATSAETRKNITNPASKSTDYIKAKVKGDNGYRTATQFCNEVYPTIDAMLDDITTIMKTAGYAESDINSAVSSAKGYYHTLISSFVNKYIKFGKGADNNDVYGEDKGTHYETINEEKIPISYYHRERSCSNLSSTSSTGMSVRHSKAGDDTYKFDFDGAKVLDKVLSYLK